MAALKSDGKETYAVSATRPAADSPYRAVISGAVLKLQESGKLVQLKELWWKQEDGGGSCNKVSWL